MAFQLLAHTVPPRLLSTVCSLPPNLKHHKHGLTLCIDAAESLSREVAPIGIKTLLVEPGTFRTDLLNQQNMKTVPTKIEDYRELSATLIGQFANLNGNQPGDARKGVERIIDVVKGENGIAGKEWPHSLLLGPDAVLGIRKKCEDVLRQVAEWEALSTSTNL